MTDKLKQQLKFLAEVDKMKNIFRQTLILDKSRHENDAEHSWHIAIMAMTLFEYVGFDGVDLNRVIKMVIVHDLVEIYAGDVPAFDVKGNEGKAECEKESADKLFSLLPTEQATAFRSLWEEFEEMATPDAMYANAIDRLQPFLSSYLTEGHPWIKFNVTAAQIYKRMNPVKTALPELWDFVEYVINEGCEKGFVQR